MAKVECIVHGLDELIEDMNKHVELADAKFDELLEAGAEETKQAWIRSAEKHKHKQTGDMIENIDWVKRKSGMGDLKNAHIYPLGKDERGIRHAAKAFWRNYGTSQKAGTYWVTTAVNDASKTVPPILHAMWTRFLRGDD